MCRQIATVDPCGVCLIVRVAQSVYLSAAGFQLITQNQ